MVESNQVTIDKDRYNYWLGVGAKPSEKVAKIAANN